MQLYVNRSRPMQAHNQQQFRQLMADFPDLEFFHPDWDKAPWHVQCIVDEGVILNFWPHTAKAQQEYCPSVEGWDEVRKLVENAVADDDIDVLEF